MPCSHNANYRTLSKLDCRLEGSVFAVYLIFAKLCIWSAFNELDHSQSKQKQMVDSSDIALTNHNIPNYSTSTPLLRTSGKPQEHTHTHTDRTRQSIVSTTSFFPPSASSHVILWFLCAWGWCRCSRGPWLMWSELHSSFCVCAFPRKP